MGVLVDKISYAMDRYGNEREFCFNVKESESAEKRQHLINPQDIQRR